LVYYWVCGCGGFLLYSNPKSAIFSIGLHKGDLALLEMIRASLGGVGNITKQGNDLIRFRVSSTKDLKVIIDHFNKYPLITQKRADFELFKLIVDIISRKEHLTTEGLRKIVNLRPPPQPPRGLGGRGVQAAAAAAWPGHK